MRVQFWGVRGSVPAPITGSAVEAKLARVLEQARRDPDFAASSDLKHWLSQIPFEDRSTYGGNTTCVEVRCGDQLIVLDMGTGLRELGRSMIPEILANKGMRGMILQSHLHWDHIQGFPFWGPLYMPREVFDNRFAFYGGKSWESQLETVLAGQMNAPVFPVNFHELRYTAMQMDFHSIYHGWSKLIELGPESVRITARKLNHPQETFGYRIEHGGSTMAFTTDHEPYAAGIHKPLIDLVQGADVWITDCQYTHDMYIGKLDGVQKLGWGHSFPEYIAEVARQAKPGLILATHHDPTATDEQIRYIATLIETLSGIRTLPAYEGMSHLL